MDWEGSLGSDHAALHITARTKPDPQHAPIPTADPGYLIEDGAKQKWLETFTQLSMCQIPLQPSPELTREEVDLAAEELEADINDATALTCWKQRPFHPKAAPWWNKACSHAAAQLRVATSTQSKRTAAACLKGVVRAARHAWANHTVILSDIWEVATWHLGRRVTKIPPIRGEQGLCHHQGFST